MHGSPVPGTPSGPSQGNLQTSSDENGADIDTTEQSMKLPVGDEVETSSEVYLNSNDLVNSDIDRAVRDIECVASPPNVVSRGRRHSVYKNILSLAIRSTFSDKNTSFIIFGGIVYEL